MTFYREPNGDYMVIYEENGYRNGLGVRIYEGKGAAIGRNPRSAGSVSASEDYLDMCEVIDREEVPVEWLNSLDPAE